MLRWRATFRDGTFLREDDQPCAWHAGYDDPSHAEACLGGRPVQALAWYNGDTFVAGVRLPVGAVPEIRRISVINLTTGQHLGVRTHVVGWTLGDESEYACVRWDGTVITLPDLSEVSL